jgi:hypothetical protein
MERTFLGPGSKKPVGWRKEPGRHALAAKGIKTGTKKKQTTKIGQRRERIAYMGSAFYSESQWYWGPRTLLGKQALVKEAGWYGPVRRWRSSAYQAQVRDKQVRGKVKWEYRIVELGTRRLMAIGVKDSKAEAKEEAEVRLRHSAS